MLYRPVTLVSSPVIAQPPSLSSRLRHLELLILLGALQAFAPLSIDMYLPAMPVIEKVFDSVMGAGKYRVQRNGDPRELFGVTVSAAR